jgi:hypothetical protein
MNDTAQHSRLEELLGTKVDEPTVDLHEFRPSADLDVRTTYARVATDPAGAAELGARARLHGDTDPQARVLLPSGWQVEPGDPPAWWPDPATLADQRARLLAPNGWLVSGHADGWWYVLAVESGEIAEVPTAVR